MPENPEQIQIEEALRRAAEGRRADYGLQRTMPPWMRDALLREVRKSFPAPPQPSRSGLPLNVLVRWAGALCLLAIAIGVPLILRDQILHDGKQQPTARPQEVDRTRVSKTEPESAAGLERREMPKDELRRDSAKEEFAARREFSLKRSESDAEAAVTTATRSFRNAETVYSNVASTKSGILRNFEIEIRAEQVVVTDEDGSQYTGKIVPAAMRHVLKQTGGFSEDERAESETKRRASEVPAAEESLSQAGHYKAAATDSLESNASSRALFFRALGLSKTAQKRVVFEGKIEMIEAVSLAPAMETSGDTAVTSAMAANRSSKSLPSAAAPPAHAGSSLESPVPDAQFEDGGALLPGSTSVMPAPLPAGNLRPSRIVGNAVVNGEDILAVDAFAQP
jgi:hypothetical protein